MSYDGCFRTNLNSLLAKDQWKTSFSWNFQERSLQLYLELTTFVDVFHEFYLILGKTTFLEHLLMTSPVPMYDRIAGVSNSYNQVSLGFD